MSRKAAATICSFAIPILGYFVVRTENISRVDFATWTLLLYNTLFFYLFSILKKSIVEEIVKSHLFWITEGLLFATSIATVSHSFDKGYVYYSLCLVHLSFCYTCCTMGDSMLKKIANVAGGFLMIVGMYVILVLLLLLISFAVSLFLTLPEPHYEVTPVFKWDYIPITVTVYLILMSICCADWDKHKVIVEEKK